MSDSNAHSLTFIDICAGIGGFRSGLEQAGHKCIGWVEIDKFARKSYEAIYDTTGEWTATDIREVRAGDIPDAELWCFGFPCQDISVAGKRTGLNGGRSGVFYDICELLQGKSTEDRPEWLLIENVKNLLSIDGGQGFAEVLTALDKAGYDAEWCLLNSKDYGVPQNRERVFIVGHLRERGTRQVLFKAGSGGQVDCKVIPIIPGHQGYRVYDSDGLSVTLKAKSGGVGAKTGLYAISKIKTIATGINQRENIQEHSGLARTLTATDYKEPQSVAIPAQSAIPCLTPDRLNKRQNGRRFKEAEDPMFTLTAQDRHGILLHDGKEYYIRRLTPRECFRLQGFTDEQFDKAKEVNSDSQLYKQAGNAVTVNVAYYLGTLLATA